MNSAFEIRALASVPIASTEDLCAGVFDITGKLAANQAILDSNVIVRAHAFLASLS